MLKKLDILKMIYHHFFKNLSKIEIFCLFMYGSIIVKMDNFHLFEEVPKFLFHVQVAMGNEIYKQHGFFLHVRVVNVVVHFVMGLVIIIHHKKYTCLQTIQFFHLCAFHT